MNSPTPGGDIPEAIIGEIDTFTNAHAGMAQQQEDICRKIVATEQLLLDELILLCSQSAGLTLRRARKILAADQTRQLGELGGPGKFFQDTAKVREAIDVNSRR